MPHWQWQNVSMLDFTPLSKAVATLVSALQETAGRSGDLLARDGCIQRFEYTYELCVKSLRRQLEEMADSPGEIDALGYKDMLRLAVERGSLMPLRGLVFESCATRPPTLTTLKKRPRFSAASPVFWCKLSCCLIV